MSLKITPKIILCISLFGIGMTGIGGVAFADGWDPRFGGATNTGSIEQTRHNLTLSYNSNPNASLMNNFRNNYGETCVYCHTPHGANSQINAPLWNRTINNADNYSIYDTPTTLGLEGRLNLPGPSSLTCLSCHDGTIAIDSVLNMPGSGLAPNSNLRNLEVGSPNMDFLNRWGMSNSGMGTNSHFALGPEPGTGGPSGCTVCHNINSDTSDNPDFVPFAPDFAAFILGTNLRNDHVVGITYPTTFGPGIDYNEPEVIIPGKWSFFDSNGNRFAEKDEVRLYDSGNGPAVECASCHDPHGIPSNGPGTQFIPSFLRISNSTPNNNGIGGPSGLCLTCHAK